MRALLHLRTWTAWLALILIPLSTAACGAFGAGTERTAMPGQTATVTPSDLTTLEPTITSTTFQPTPSPTGTPPLDRSGYLSVERKGGVLGDVWELADLRYGLHPDRVQIVWEMVEPGDHVPAFQVVEVDNAATPFPTGHDPSWGEARIDLVVSDLYARTAPAVRQLPLTLPDNPLVTRIGFYPTFSDSCLGFSIGLSEPAAYNVYELTDPVRIVIAVLYPPEVTPAPGPMPTSTATPMPVTPTPIPGSSSTPLAPTMTLTTTCTYPWFFPHPPAACAGQPPVNSLTVAQHFERGLMLWREAPDVYGSQIYVFFTDNIWPYWNPTNDRWRSGMLESDPAIVPPPGYYQPVRGFGLFWREAYFGTIDVSARDRLGWATGEEYSLGELPMQCHANDGYQPRCYLAGPDDGPSAGGLVYAVRPDNSWFVWQGPSDVPAPVIADPILEPESSDCTSEEWADTVWPQLSEVQLTETASGAEVKVVGSGGYLYWGGKCGRRYDESARSFELALDGEPVGSMGCYVNHCEATLSFPADALWGTHTISVEGGSSITIQVTPR